MKGLFIAWGVILVGLGIGVNWGSDSTFARTYLKKDPLLVLADKESLTAEDKKALTEVIFQVLGDEQLNLSKEKSSQLAHEAQYAFKNLYRQSNKKERRYLITRLVKIHTQNYGDHVWKKRKFIVQMFADNFHHDMIKIFHKKVLSIRRPTLHDKDADKPYRQIAIELAANFEPARKALFDQLEREFEKGSKGAAGREMVGSPCPISRSGAFLFEALTDLGFEMASNRKKQIMQKFLAVASDQKFDGSGELDGRPQPRTTRLDALRMLSRLELESHQEIDILAPVLMDKDAPVALQKISAQLISIVLRQKSQTGREIAEYLAHMHKRCDRRPNFAYLAAFPQTGGSRRFGRIPASNGGFAQLSPRQMFIESHRIACAGL